MLAAAQPTPWGKLARAAAGRCAFLSERASNSGLPRPKLELLLRKGRLQPAMSSDDTNALAMVKIYGEPTSTRHLKMTKPLRSWDKPGKPAKPEAMGINCNCTAPVEGDGGEALSAFDHMKREDGVSNLTT